MITKVTITGADDSIQPAELLALTREFPFVEWGILLSRSSMGNNRFPSTMWLLTLARYQKSLAQTGQQLTLSGHLCGRWVKDILVGKHEFVDALTPEVWDIFSRIQINTHAEFHSATAVGIGMLNRLRDKEFIFQYDNVNTILLELARNASVNHSALFDLSHGVGKLPSQWPDLIQNLSCGYAGGLSPENLREQIYRIEEKAGDTPIWIDMETHVRSNNDKQFDLGKVRACLEIASEFIEAYWHHE
ncbi:hypothetical protein [Spirosoma sp.]|uniref:hypothetical protein n=1 Tax=Spirosoma sp. TaxID=1899569 RepID=UPI00260FF386|nr:hypothetical protein [Spirosoma sp.]MCX6217684.1 hypothetical protein [Spirosoma sp.]